MRRITRQSTFARNASSSCIQITISFTNIRLQLGSSIGLLGSLVLFWMYAPQSQIKSTAMESKFVECKHYSHLFKISRSMQICFAEIHHFGLSQSMAVYLHSWYLVYITHHSLYIQLRLRDNLNVGSKKQLFNRWCVLWLYIIIIIIIIMIINFICMAPFIQNNAAQSA